MKLEEGRNPNLGYFTKENISAKKAINGKPKRKKVQDNGHEHLYFNG